MKAPYLAQLLCPQRHCIIAAVAEYDSLDAAVAGMTEQIKTHFEQMVALGVANAHCGLCKSKAFHVEVGKSIFEDVETAVVVMTLEGQMAQRSIPHIAASLN